jgi:photosystem II stability/assembly factor-like uncharacterized protein
VADKVVTAGMARVWIQPDGPNTRMFYAGCYGVGDVAIPEGDITYIRCPSNVKANEWKITGEIVGTPGNKTTSMEAPLGLVNYLLSIKCKFGFQVRFGECSRPDDPAGWELMLAFEDAKITNRGVTQINGRNPDNNNEAMTTADITFAEMYFVKTRSWTSAVITAQSGATLKDVTFCDSPTCAGACGTGSSGCQVGYVITAGIAAGGGEEIWKTLDGGDSWTRIQSPFTDVYDDMVAIDCVDDVVIVVNGTTADTIARSADGGATWSIINVGLNKILTDVFMLDSMNIWVCGEDGRIAKSADGGLTWTAQEAGVATAEDLNEIHFFDENYGLAVGDAGAILRTINGGVDWELVSSGVATNLLCCRAVTKFIFWVGGASGTLLYSMDSGATWNVKSWPGAGTDTINAIEFYGNEFGFFGATSAGAAGVLYSTVDGGYTMGVVTLPSNVGINRIYMCDPNTVYIATNGSGRLIYTA